MNDKLLTAYKIFPIFFVFLIIFFVFPKGVYSAGTSNFQLEIIPGYQCYDGQDNDNDGLVDYPDDPGCSGYTDNDETDAVAPYCGDGSCNNGENCSTCSADCGQCPSGGGGGGGVSLPATSVTFSGRAYPLSKVTVLKDGQKAVTTIAGPGAKFNTSITGLSAGNYIFSLYGEDNQDQRSTLFTFPVYITIGATTNITGIFIAPTINVDKKEVKRGDNIAIFGQSAPNSEIIISVNSDKEFFEKTQSDQNGVYLYNFDSSVLKKGNHYTKSKAAVDGKITSFGKTIGFLVGAKNIIKAVEESLKGDLSGDGRVNLIDFSIAAYWYKQTLSAKFASKEAQQLNSDGKIDLIDFSIMAFYWTG